MQLSRVLFDKNEMKIPMYALYVELLGDISWFALYCVIWYLWGWLKNIKPNGDTFYNSCKMKDNYKPPTLQPASLKGRFDYWLFLDIGTMGFKCKGLQTIELGSLAAQTSKHDREHFKVYYMQNVKRHTSEKLGQKRAWNFLKHKSYSTWALRKHL